MADGCAALPLMNMGGAGADGFYGGKGAIFRA